MKELFGTSLASKKLQCGKYFALKHPYNSESFSCNRHHPCLANMAKLNNLMSRKPIPPSFLGQHNALQLFQWIFLSLPTCPHQNLVHIALRSLHSFTGNWKTPIEYIEMDCATTYIRTSFPAFDKSCPLQP